jgi:hypothetical protein
VTVGDPRERALYLLAVCDGLLDAGRADHYAHAGRLVASDLLDALEMVEAERSARRAAQERAQRIGRLLFDRRFSQLARKGDA